MDQSLFCQTFHCACDDVLFKTMKAGMYVVYMNACVCLCLCVTIPRLSQDVMYVTTYITQNDISCDVYSKLLSNSYLLDP